MKLIDYILSFFVKPKTIYSPGWSFGVEIDGSDLVVRDCTATWFGGANDPLDNGETASGVSTAKNPKILGCALPVLPGNLCKSTANSPLPRIPWFTPVEVTCGNKTMVVSLIDNGPARSAGDAIDLTQSAFRFFEPSLSVGVLRHVNYRIVGGAKYLPR